MHVVARTGIRESISSVYDTLTITVWVRGTINNVGRAVLANDTDIVWGGIDPMFYILDQYFCHGPGVHGVREGMAHRPASFFD